MISEYITFVVKGEKVLISKADKGRVISLSWLLDTGGQYVGRWFYCPKRWVPLARFIDETPKGKFQVDHINQDTFDNRRENLRRCTRAENSRNTGPHRGRFKGVSFATKRHKWRACIYLKGSDRHLGYFEKEIDAAIAYNKRAKSEWGDFAWLNPVGDS